MRRWLLILLLLPGMVHAKHYFEVGVHGGLAGWDAQTVYVNPSVGYNAGGQLFYSYHSPYVIGLRTGLTLDHYNAGFGKTNYEDTYTTIDVENQRMQVDYSIGTLSERYYMWSVGIPLQLAFSKWGFTLLAGAKAVLPLTATWKQIAGNAALSVYYPDYDNRVYEAFPLAASRHFEMANDGYMRRPLIQWWLTGEFNYTLPLKTNSRHYYSYLIVGAYFDYCLTKMTPEAANRASLIMLTDTRDGFPLSRVLTPVMEGRRQGAQLVNNCTLFDVGIKISYAISPYDSSSQPENACRCQ